MDFDFESSKTWQKTLGLESNKNVNLLRQHFLDSRKKIEAMLQNIEAEISGLTVHDISHIDALWGVSDQIIGDIDYLNPAEGYVLGCAFLLHDAAHVSAAYQDGLSSLKLTDEWKDLVGLKYNNLEPNEKTPEHASLIFEVARIYHAKQAGLLAKESWIDRSNDTTFYFIDNAELRSAYGEMIGQIAESHNWNPEKVYNTFQHRKINPPGFLNEESWEVDCLKIAFILRTADASHIDSRRAPTYLYSFINPQNISRLHWMFQHKLGKVVLTSEQKLRITSSSSFNENERNAWWLAYDTAKMIDKELKSSLFYLTEGRRIPLSAQSVLGIESPASFSTFVTVNRWEPEETSVYISNLPHLIKTLGGNALYGNNDAVAFRELIQNGIDSIKAATALGYLNIDEGLVKIAVDDIDEENLSISIIDNGLGMSKYVLKNVLLNFGNSLWNSNNVIYEHPTLLQKNFSSIGKFGIGFYSVFMISECVQILTRRYEMHTEEESLSWKLKFENGLQERPYISIPERTENLKRHGTKVTFNIKKEKLFSIITKEKENNYLRKKIEDNSLSNELFVLKQIISHLFPASAITIEIEHNSNKEVAVKANDWIDIDSEDLLNRRHLIPRAMWHNVLHPIYNNGKLVGRLNVESYGHMNNANFAIVCHGGIRSGTIHGLSGICITDRNNEKAERMDCQPDYPIQSWIDWAKSIVTTEQAKTINCLIRLHPLIPNEDLMVWHLDGERCFLSNLIHHAKEKKSLTIHIGDIYYEGSEDEVSEGAFDDHFTEIENLIIIPRNRRFHSEEELRTIDFLSTLPGKDIDYLTILKNALTNEFDKITLHESEKLVGYVKGNNINRDTITIDVE